MTRNQKKHLSPSRDTHSELMPLQGYPDALDEGAALSRIGRMRAYIGNWLLRWTGS